MSDPGYIVIAIFAGIVGLIFWSKRSPSRRRFPGGLTSQPGRRHEGADYTRNTSGGDDGGMSD